MSLFEKIVDMIENSDDSKSFQLTTKDGKSHKAGCLVIVAATIFIFHGMFSTYDSGSQTSVQVETSSTTSVVSEEMVVTSSITEDVTTMSTNEITVNPKYTTYDGDNSLMALTIKATEIPKISKNRGYVEISKNEFEKITDKDYLEFCKNVISSKADIYNYFTIDFKDGTGICFAGCYIYDATYGFLDDTGAVDKKIGSIEIDIENEQVSSDTFSFIES